ncbi:hypothetical protein LSM04_008202 [Trypanosoma melophagium]|uniref:uncharacterized protein n=1 Tax=Trypanosoma melophagium TaxID=715481 RepID=UPI003519DD14|nr:hypothetical protein LSM04_008202 [Trypanosoma melophagium]
MGTSHPPTTTENASRHLGWAHRIPTKETDPSSRWCRKHKLHSKDKSDPFAIRANQTLSHPTCHVADKKKANARSHMQKRHRATSAQPPLQITKQVPAIREEGREIILLLISLPHI